MTKRGSFLVPLLALILLLLAAAPAAAYNNENRFHLRLSRLDALACATPIRIQADLRDKAGDPVAGETVHFATGLGESGDSLAPANVVTNANGKAVTSLTLVCTSDTHHIQVVASGPGGAKARINLVLHKDQDQAAADRSAAILSATTGSTGTGSGTAAATRPVAVNLATPAGSALLGVLIVVLAVFRRRLLPRTQPPATA